MVYFSIKKCISKEQIFLLEEMYLIELAGLMKKIFMYYEESDLLNRMHLLEMGYRAKFRKDLHLIHLENGSTPNSADATLREIASCKYYANKYGLNALKKIKSDYRYLLLKDNFSRVLKRNSKYKVQIDIYRKEIEREMNA